MPRIPYLQPQIELAIEKLRPHLGPTDSDRLKDIAPLFATDESVSMEHCQKKLFPDKKGKPAVDAFKAFRDRVNSAARACVPAFDLIFVVDEFRRAGAAKRVCWMEGPDLDAEQFAPRNEMAAGNVKRLPDVPNFARGPKPRVRILPLHRAESKVADELIELLHEQLAAHQSIDFQIVHPSQDAEMLLPLLGPSFFADADFLENVGRLSLDKQAFPVCLQPVTDEQSTPDWQSINQYRLPTANGAGKCYTECNGKEKQAFARGVYGGLAAAAAAALENGVWRTGAYWLKDWALGRIDIADKSFADSEAARMRLQDTARMVERPVRFQPDGKAVDLLIDWATRSDSSPFLAVLGEYGIGKTTSLKRFTLAMEQRRAHDTATPLVIFLDLRIGSDSTPPNATCEEIIQRIIDLDARPARGSKPNAATIIDAVRQRSAILIFDGLDERVVHMTTAQAEEFVRQLKSVLPAAALADVEDETANVKLSAKKRPAERGKLIISCRSHYFRTLGEQREMITGRQRDEYRKQDFEALIILPFGEEQIRDYIGKVCGKERVDALMTLFESIHNLRELSERPVLLNLLTEQIDELEELQAERGRPILAADIYLNLVERWFGRDTPKHKLKPDNKRELMERLAAYFWKNNTKQMAIEDIDRWLNDEIASHAQIKTRAQIDGFKSDMLEGDFRTGTFLVRPDHQKKHFQFAHTSFQEFFLASHLVRALKASDFAAFDLPMLSIETLDFLGQLLALEPEQQRATALAALGRILGGDCLPAAMIAFRYWLRAIEMGLPEPQPARVQLPGADLDEWRICGRGKDRLLNLRGAVLAAAKLNRCRIEHVDLVDADLTGVEMRQALLTDAHADRANLKQADLNGVQWRDGSLRSADLRDAWTACDLTHVDVAEALRSIDWSAALAPREPVPPGRAAVVTGHTSSVRACAWSPDGTRIVSGSGDTSLKVWDAATGTCRLTLQGHTTSVTACAWSPDGTRIVSGSDDNSLKVWDAATGTCRLTLQGHTTSVTACAW
ncbi:MAG TPA: pentapeptide repeat-containing protein, partial [Gemmataceae bacterium]|nr:pentapeptide repeat-containing protein [Gemmataceae bacterium]